MYKILGADQKEYGPIDAEQIRQWISEGRLNGQTQACIEGSQEWKPLGTFPEFSFLANPASTTESATPVPIEQLLAGDYTLDIGRCIGRGWELYKNNFAALFVPFLLMIVIDFATSGMTQGILKVVGIDRMPFAQRQYLIIPVMLITNALVQGPLAGGLYWIYLSVIRNRKSEIGDLFLGFKTVFSDLFLGKLVTGLILSLCMLPESIISANHMAPLMERIQQNPTSMQPMEMLSQLMSAYMSSLPVLLVCMIPATYLSVNWTFTLALIIDKQMGFWTAMKTSWKMVHKHWFHIFGLVVLNALVGISGGIGCCIGVLFTLPISVAALMFAYEDIFGRKTA